MTAIISSAKVTLLGCANAFPNQLVSTDTLLEKLQFHCTKTMARQARFIAKRLGVESRYLSRDLDKAVCNAKPSAIELSTQAINNAKKSADLTGSPFGYLLSHTATPHTLLPSNAAWISDALESTAPYMELRQACTGFASALQIAVPMLNQNPNMDPICIVSAETGSVFFDISTDFIDTQQLINYVQMGDGASSVILAPDDGTNRHVISHCFSGHIGIGKAPGFELIGGGSAKPNCDKGLPYFAHNASSVRAQGEALFFEGIDVITQQGFNLDDFKFIIPHQANGHIDTLLSKRLNIEQSRVINTAKQWGNLGSVAIWASLTQLIQSDKLAQGDKVLVLGAEATKYMYGGFVYQH
jgi:3-oxoacyl-[acyl-carrier-protein] synthase-3